jgi:hypothetical protein
MSLVTLQVSGYLVPATNSIPLHYHGVEDKACGSVCKQLSSSVLLCMPKAHDCFTLSVSVPTLSTAPAKDKIPVTSDKSIEKVLRQSMKPRFFFPDSGIPLLKALCPDVPYDTTSLASFPEELQKQLFSSLARQIKNFLSSKGIKLPALTPFLVEHVRSLLNKSFTKTASSKAKAFSPKPKKEDKSSPKANVPSASPTKAKKGKKSASNQSPATKVSTPSSKPSPSSKTPKAKAPTNNAPVAKVADVLNALKSSKAPRFYFDEQPSFKTLFPGTTRPKSTMKSGSPYVEPAQFRPLRMMLVKASHSVLRNASINVSKLPASYMIHLTRMIRHSLAVPSNPKSQSQKAKKSASKPSNSKTVTFVPASLPDAILNPPQESSFDPIDDMRSLRNYRSLLEMVITEIETQVLDSSSRPLPLLLASPLYKQYEKNIKLQRLDVSNVPSSVTDIVARYYAIKNSYPHKCSSVCLASCSIPARVSYECQMTSSMSTISKNEPFYDELKRQHRLVSSRSTLSYESILSQT